MVESPRIAVVQAPFNGDGTTPEIEDPAAALCEAGLLDGLGRRTGAPVLVERISIPRFEGTRDPETGILNRAAWRDMSRNLGDRIAEQLQHHRLPVVLGGDCALLVPVAMAMRRRFDCFRVAYIDAHADFLDPRRSPSGEPADLPVALATGFRVPELGRELGGNPLLRQDQLVILGARERDQIDESEIRVVGVPELRRDGVEAMLDSAGLLTGGPVWIHFDVDVLNPEAMPAVCFPVLGGLTWDEVRGLLGALISRGIVVGMTVVCYHPSLDRELSAARQLVKVLLDVLPGNGA